MSLLLNMFTYFHLLVVMSFPHLFHTINGKKSNVATIIKKLDLLLLFPQFAVLVFLHLLYRTFHHHHHNQAP